MRVQIAKAMETINSEKFGGGSVTIPLKEDVLPKMDLLTDSARRIGAVNTITVKVRRTPRPRIMVPPTALSTRTCKCKCSGGWGEIEPGAGKGREREHRA